MGVTVSKNGKILNFECIQSARQRFEYAIFKQVSNPKAELSVQQDGFTLAALDILPKDLQDLQGMIKFCLQLLNARCPAGKKRASRLF